MRYEDWLEYLEQEQRRNTERPTDKLPREDVVQFRYNFSELEGWCRQSGALTKKGIVDMASALYNKDSHSDRQEYFAFIKYIYSSEG